MHLLRKIKFFIPTKKKVYRKFKPRLHTHGGQSQVQVFHQVTGDNKQTNHKQGNMRWGYH